MKKRPVGLLLDTIYDNTGDKAIRIVMEDFFQRRNILYEVLNPLRFRASDYSLLVIGGGQLIREKDGGFYDAFRVPGRHILNATGVLSGRDVDYLREYEYVAVRSTADRRRLEPAVRDASVVACVSLLLKAVNVDLPIQPHTIGFHFSPDALPACDGLEAALTGFPDSRMLLIPFTHQWNDEVRLKKLAESIPSMQLGPYLQPQELFGLIGRLEYFVGSSLHACMFAYANNVPFIAFNRPDPKIAEFMADRGLEEWLFNNADELRINLERLIHRPPDYSPRVAKDRQNIREHLRRVESLIGRRVISVPAASIGEENANQTRTLLGHIQGLNEAIRDRDFFAARWRTQQSYAITEKDATLAELRKALSARDFLLTEKDALLAEKGAALAQKDAALAQKDAAVAQRDAALAQRDAALAQKDIHITNIEAALHQANVQAASSGHQLQLIHNSVGYRLLEGLRRRIRWIGPPGTYRQVPFAATSRGLNIIMTRGWRALFSRVPQIREWLPRLRRPYGDGPHATVDEQYEVWLKAHALTPARAERIRQDAAKLDYRPRISIVMPVYNSLPGWLREAIESVRGQLYDNWELCIADDASTEAEVRTLLGEYAGNERIKITHLKENQGISGASNAALATASGEFVGFLDHDDELKPEALFEVVKLLNERRDLDFVYSDEDKKYPNGRLGEPFFKPDWSPDLMLSTNYVPHFAVYRKRLVDEVGGLRTECDSSQDYDLALRVTERTERIAHIALPLYTWRMVPGSAASEPNAKPRSAEAGKKALADAMRRGGIQARIEDGPYTNTYRVRYQIQGLPLVSIVIPTRDRVDLLRRCIASIETKSTYRNYEIIIVDNDSKEETTLSYLEASPHKRLAYPGKFRYGAMMNFALRQADGEYAILLNNDTEVASQEWIEALLEHAQRSEVAAVGARLIYPNGSPQHEGVVIGVGGGSCLNVDTRNYFGLGRLVRNVSAVTAACTMVRRQLFEELGGFDEGLTVAFNDVDYCLRARKRGYLIVQTPYAVLFHDEGASRGRYHPNDDETRFRRRWGKPGRYRDPYYNPNLSRTIPFTIETEGKGGTGAGPVTDGDPQEASKSMQPL